MPASRWLLPQGCRWMLYHSGSIPGCRQIPTQAGNDDVMEPRRGLEISTIRITPPSSWSNEPRTIQPAVDRCRASQTLCRAVGDCEICRLGDTLPVRKGDIWLVVVKSAPLTARHWCVIPQSRSCSRNGVPARGTWRFVVISSQYRQNVGGDRAFR